MEWLANIEIGPNYHQYDNHGVLCRKCGWPLHNNRTLHWHDDATKQRLKDTTFPIPAICDMSGCGEEHRCELCSEPMKWHYQEFDGDDYLSKMLTLRDEDGIVSVQEGDGLMWMECSMRHPHGPPPHPGIIAKKLYRKSDEMVMSKEDHDLLEAEQLLERAIDIYARMGLTIAAIQISMKLAMLVYSRANTEDDLNYVNSLFDFANGLINDPPGYEDQKSQAKVSMAILRGYIAADLAIKSRDKEAFKLEVELMNDAYEIAIENDFQNSIRVFEQRINMVQNRAEQIEWE